MKNLHIGKGGNLLGGIWSWMRKTACIRLWEKTVRRKRRKKRLSFTGKEKKQRCDSVAQHCPNRQGAHNSSFGGTDKELGREERGAHSTNSEKVWETPPFERDARRSGGEIVLHGEKRKGRDTTILQRNLRRIDPHW